MAAWCYVLECADASFYIGCTTNLDQRMGEHQVGLHPGYTSKRLPVQLVWSETFDDLNDAIACERRLKSWSRGKKLALVAGDWTALRRLSLSHQHHGAAERGESLDTVAPRPARDDDVGK